MNKKITFLAITLAVAISAAAFVFNKKNPNPNGAPGSVNAEQESDGSGSSPTPPATPATGSANTSSPSAATSSPPSSGPSLPVNDETMNAKITSKWAEIPLTPAETKSVKAMTATLVKFFDPKLGNPDLLMKEFAKAGLQPVIAKDFNQYTGKMIVVRCNNPPPGTRCCHAQYFEDENKKPFLQHMSFELRPSKDGMETAAAALNAALKTSGKGALGKAVSQTADSAHWDLKDDYSATIMKLTADEDLRHDPFCAHEIPDDRGLFKVMIEMVPDKDEDEGHASGH